MNFRDNQREKKHRADMYWPWWVLVLGIGSIGLGIALSVNAYDDYGTLDRSSLMALLILLFTGICLILVWKNQTIRMEPETDTFVYTSLFGRKTVLSFADIADFKTGVGRNSGSITLIFKSRRKLYIDSSAVLSDQLVWRLNRELSKRNQPILDKM